MSRTSYSREPTGGQGLSQNESSESSELSAELASVADEFGLLLPTTKEWERLSTALGLSTESRDLLMVNWIAGETYSESLANFAVEIISRIPVFHVLDYFFDDSFNALPEVGRMSLLQAWIMRTRIFRFPKRATPERLALMNPYISRTWTSMPFIEAIWDQGRISEISLLGFAAIQQERRSSDAALLAMGMELFRDDIDTRALAASLAQKLLVIIGDRVQVIRKQKRGGNRRKPKDFNPEMCRRLVLKTQELQPLWDFIADFFKTNDYDGGCVTMLKGHSRFRELAAVCETDVPDDLLTAVFQRKTFGGKKYWPMTFALQHAVIELGIANAYSFETLHDYHKKGRKLFQGSSPETNPD